MGPRTSGPDRRPTAWGRGHPKSVSRSSSSGPASLHTSPARLVCLRRRFYVGLVTSSGAVGAQIPGERQVHVPPYKTRISVGPRSSTPRGSGTGLVRQETNKDFVYGGRGTSHPTLHVPDPKGRSGHPDSVRPGYLLQSRDRIHVGAGPLSTVSDSGSLTRPRPAPVTQGLRPSWDWTSLPPPATPTLPDLCLTPTSFLDLRPQDVDYSPGVGVSCPIYPSCPLSPRLPVQSDTDFKSFPRSLAHIH